MCNYPCDGYLQRAVQEYAGGCGNYGGGCSNSVKQAALNKYGNINTWDVSAVTDMSWIFYQWVQPFNEDISSWDTRSAVTMERMFQHAASFNQNINSWDVSKVTSMHAMFLQAYSYNQPMNSWYTRSLTDLGNFAADARILNQDISMWDVSGVTNYYAVFNGASSISVANQKAIHCMWDTGWGGYYRANSGTYWWYRGYTCPNNGRRRLSNDLSLENSDTRANTSTDDVLWVWPDTFAEPADCAHNTRFDYVLIIPWSVGRAHIPGHSDFVTGSTEGDIIDVARAWIHSFDHGVDLAKGGIIMTYNGSASWAIEFPYVETESVLLALGEWIDDHPRIEQNANMALIDALSMVDTKFQESISIRKDIYMFIFDDCHHDKLHEMFNTLYYFNSLYQVYMYSFAGYLPPGSSFQNPPYHEVSYPIDVNGPRLRITP